VGGAELGAIGGPVVTIARDWSPKTPGVHCERLGLGPAMPRRIVARRVFMGRPHALQAPGSAVDAATRRPVDERDVRSVARHPGSPR
jgi:hypothetical protein